jgi:hypothetical protein
MTPYLDPRNPDCPSTLIGFESRTPDAADAVDTSGKHPFAHFLVRDCTGAYTARKIVDADFAQATLVATRTILNSPFPSDPPGTIYAGGFDAGNLAPHNSAWLYRGVPR